MNQTRNGYTLMELIVVLAILSLSLSIVAPTLFKGISGTRLKATVREISATLRYARNLAITQRAMVFFACNLDDQSYTYQIVQQQQNPLVFASVPSDNPESPEPVPAPENGNQTEGDTSQNTMKIAAPLRLLSFSDVEGNSYEDGTHGIVFFSKGGSTGGSLQIGKPNGQSLLIIVDPVTSGIEVQQVTR